MASVANVFTEWTPEPPDSRDHGPQSPAVRKLLERKRASARKGAKPPAIPKRVDLREWCPAPKLQGNFNTCAAHVVAALVDYFERRTFGTSVAPSRRFLFRVAKNL